MISSFLSIPKSELHVHLRGAIPLEVLTDLLNKYSDREVWRGASERQQARFHQYENIRPFLDSRHWEAHEVAPLFHYESFDQFLATYAFTGFLVRDSSDLRKLISGVLQSLIAENVVYAEIMITIVEYLRSGISLSDILDCLQEATDHSGIRVRWIADLARNIGSDAALALLKQIIDLRCQGIVGITLGGNEELNPPAQFAEVYRMALDHGLRLTVHAGEGLGPESVWDAIKVLNVERIGHGVRSIEDPALVAYLAENQIPLEVCPTSNLRTGIFPSYQAHPIKNLFDAGVPVAINSDDPTMFGTTLSKELSHMAELGFDDGQLLQLLENGFEYSFLPKQDADQYRKQLRTAWESLDVGC